MKLCRHVLLRYISISILLLVIFQLFLSLNICENSSCCLDFSPSSRRINLKSNSTNQSSFHERFLNVSCLHLMQGDQSELEKAMRHMKDHSFELITDAQVAAELGSGCNARSWMNNTQVTTEELNFPIAYVILVYKDTEQLVRLLRTIYRSHNVYCIHIDTKSTGDVMAVVQILADCLPNVHLPDERENVVYASYARLKAELNCMKKLLDTSATWKYVINLSAQMLPLKTNLELVKILGTFEGTNDVEGISMLYLNRVIHRYDTKHIIQSNKIIKTKESYVDPPHGIRLVKGSAYGSFSRQLIEFIFTDPTVQDFLQWCQYTYSPDEIFWATINSRWVNPIFRTPGGYDGAPERKPWLSTHVAWRGKDKCAGKFVRNICVFGVGDLPRLLHRKELFANKFHYGYEYLAGECIEEWLHNKTHFQLPVDLEYYRDIKRLLDYKN